MAEGWEWDTRRRFVTAEARMAELRAKDGQEKIKVRDGEMVVSIAAAAMLREHGPTEQMTEAEAVALLDAHPEFYICDFCSQPGVEVSYEVADFDTGWNEPGGGRHIMKGGWAACRVCADLVEQDDRVGLASRGADVFIRKNPEARSRRSQIIGVLRELHDEFFRLRRGPAIPEVRSQPVTGRLEVPDGLALFDGKRRLTR